MEKIDMTFVRTVESKLDDCTTPIQFREVLNRFKDYLYNGQVSKLFQNRLLVLRNLKCSVFGADMFDDMEEELENLISHICTYSPNSNLIKKKSTKGRKKDKPLEPESTISIDIQVKSKEGLLLGDAKMAVIKVVLEKALGKKKEACRILGISMSELTEAIKSQDVKLHMRHVKSYVKREVIKNKF